MLRRVVLSSARVSRVQTRSVSRTSASFAAETPKSEETPTPKPEEETRKAEELSETQQLQQQVEQLSAQNKDANDRLLRALADAENVRRISRVDVSNAREFAISKFAKALLDVSDNLKRAHESINVEETPLEPEKQLEAIKVLHEGVVMTETQLQKVFREFKIQQVGAVGDKFDPNVHDALFEYEDAAREAGVVGQLMKTGYLLNDRVIRPAQVGVVKAPKTQ
ncbi:GrpE protein 1, mitochondrial [Phytophthora pseudosyringae]|uniref:GrpE protein 1, mitochondrial n=1 Tax=Phytophthora pseudosyringae TaxID=221518 RepID=A0A8T1V7C2_9STRA|nr:GrpE protein 1, mitochondrial [Phytophthora pseudosyringae]